MQFCSHAFHASCKSSSCQPGNSLHATLTQRLRYGCCGLGVPGVPAKPPDARGACTGTGAGVGLTGSVTGRRGPVLQALTNKSSQSSQMTPRKLRPPRA